MNAYLGMKRRFIEFPQCYRFWFLAIPIAALIGPGCAPPKAQPRKVHAANPLAIVLAPHDGSGKLDVEIRRWQDKVRHGRNVEPSLERLGWSFVTKARETFDPGFYLLAQECARALESRRPHSPEALLLRGHCLHNLHRFKEAEPLARELVETRGSPFDYGLLSDVLLEQGKLDEAGEACQKMLDLRPDLNSYARGAHLRWLKGNVKGALSLMLLAVGASSPLNPESAAWVHTRLAGYQFQLGEIPEAERSCAQALEFRTDYPPALLLKGRLLLAQGDNAAATPFLRRAAGLIPLPEYQWALSEALQADGRPQEASAIEKQLSRSGAAADPRTYSLYLTTRGEKHELAVELARAELNSRTDVFTHDALGWALAAGNHLEEARDEIRLALAEGTQDARLFFHSAVIEHRSGNEPSAQQWMQRASALKHLLLPSERAQLETFPLTLTVMNRSGNIQPKGNTQ